MGVLLIHSNFPSSLINSSYKVCVYFQCHISWSVLCSLSSVKIIVDVIVRFVDIGGIDDHHCLNIHAICSIQTHD